MNITLKSMIVVVSAFITPTGPVKITRLTGKLTSTEAFQSCTPSKVEGYVASMLKSEFPDLQIAPKWSDGKEVPKSFAVTCTPAGRGKKTCGVWSFDVSLLAAYDKPLPEFTHTWSTACAIAAQRWKSYAIRTLAPDASTEAQKSAVWGDFAKMNGNFPAVEALRRVTTELNNALGNKGLADFSTEKDIYVLYTLAGLARQARDTIEVVSLERDRLQAFHRPVRRRPAG